MTTKSLSRRRFVSAFSAAFGATAVAAAPALAKESSDAASSDMPEQTFDAVVLGGSAAGLVTAISAHDAGAKVVVLEKCDRPDGNSIYSMGCIAAWGTNFQNSLGIKDSREDFYDTMMKVSVGRADPDLTRVYTDNITDGVNWLQDELKVPFKRVLNFTWPILRRACQVDGKGMTGGGGLVQTLLQRARERGIPILFEHKAIKLETNAAGAVTAVIAQTPTQKIRFKARGGVALCTGGFSANQELTGIYIGEWASRLSLRGSHSVTGENITLTKPLFAKLVNMGHFHSGPISSETHTNPAEVLNCGYGVVVNMQGKRFVDESFTYVTKAKTCAQLTPENKAWVIMDSQWENIAATVKKYKNMNAVYCSADSLDELCKKAGIEAKAAVQSVNAYNKAVDDKTTAAMTPPCTYAKPHKVEKGPFYAFPFEGGMTATYGGPKIDVKGRVLNLENKPIAGLYAAGNAAGGLFYKDYLGGSQLGACTVFGRIVGREMAERAKKA